MNRICPAQIKAARALLGWSQDELAVAANLSIATIRKIELGAIPRHSTINSLREVVERQGVEFTELDGVRRRAQGVKVFETIEMLQGDIEDSIKEMNDCVYAVLKDPNVLVDLSGVERVHGSKEMSSQVKIKALLSEAQQIPNFSRSIEVRVISKNHICPSSYFIYGKKHALVLSEGKGHIRFVVFNSILQTEAYKAHFHPLWDVAFPISEVMSAYRAKG